jgi:hypothetical protein
VLSSLSDSGTVTTVNDGATDRELKWERVLQPMVIFTKAHGESCMQEFNGRCVSPLRLRYTNSLMTFTYLQCAPMGWWLTKSHEPHTSEENSGEEGGHGPWLAAPPPIRRRMPMWCSSCANNPSILFIIHQTTQPTSSLLLQRPTTKEEIHPLIISKPERIERRQL